MYYALSSYGQSELLGEISRMRTRNYEMAYYVYWPWRLDKKMKERMDGEIGEARENFRK